MRSLKVSCMTALAASLSIGGVAKGVLVNVDINSNQFSQNSPTCSGAGVLGGSSDVWNGIYGPTTSGTVFSGLVDSTGTSTGITLTFTGPGQLNCYDNPDQNGQTSSSVGHDLLRDYEYSFGDSIGVTINGLTPGGVYNLVGYGAGDTSGQGGAFSGALTGTTDGTSRDGYILGVDYLQNSTAIADSSGSISFVDASMGDQGIAILNGFQISSVGGTPEPASLGLIGVGTIRLLARRRARNSLSNAIRG